MGKKKELKCPDHIQSNSSAFFKKKEDAIKCRKEIYKKEPHQVKLRLKKTKHVLNGAGWLLQA